MKSEKRYDVIVVGTGAGGGIAVRTLAEAGLKVCALNGGRKLDRSKDYRNHRQPFDMPFRGFNNPESAKHACGFMDNEYGKDLWERELVHTTGPGTKWFWPKLLVEGGKTNFWGRSSARFADMDFRASSIDGVDVDWPVTYEEIAPYYSRVEKMIGVASSQQNRPSNPDGEYLPPFKFRCLDKILEAGCKKIGLPYLPDRIAQLTEDLGKFPKCHFCGNCSNGCEAGSFYSSPWRMLPQALATGNVDLRYNALVKNVLTDETGRATGVTYVDRDSKQEVKVLAKAVVLAAGNSETTRIMLNSKSNRYPAGFANSSGQLGKNLCDQLYGTTVYGMLPQLKGSKPFPDNVSDNTIAWLPRWQNLKKPREENFVRGYAMYVGGGCGNFPSFHDRLEGFGSKFKKEIREIYPTPISFYTQAPSLPSPGNFIDIDPVVKDKYGIPAARFHFQWGKNELNMFKHAIKESKRIFKASGGEIWGTGQPELPGTSLHESGTARMGNDPKKFVTDKWGRAHDAQNLFLADASIFTSSNDKPTTMSIITFSLRGVEKLVAEFKAGNIV
jgi:choline dehydrogenase-like flavoprotein